MELLGKLGIRIFVIAIIGLAIIVGSVRLLVSNIDYFKPEIEYLLTRDVSEGIVFAGVSGAMNGLNPQLHLKNVSINLPDRSQPLFIDQLSVEFDFWASLQQQGPVLLEVSGQLEKLELTKDESGRWWSHQLALGAVDGAIIEIPDLEPFLKWVPRYLKLNLRRLIIKDQATGKDFQLDRVAAQINYRRGQFFTQVSTALPDQLGQGIVAKAVINPDRSVIYVNASGLQVVALAEILDIDALGLRRGILDGELWFNLAKNEVVAVNGELLMAAGKLHLAEEKPSLTIDYRASFSAVHRQSTWQIKNRVKQLRVNGQDIPEFNSQVEITTREQAIDLSAWLEHFPVASMSAIAGLWLPQEVSQQLGQGKLQGLLEDLVLRVNPALPQTFQGSGRVTNLSSLAAGNYPGVSNLNADFLVNNGQLSAQIHGNNVSLDFADQFKAPLVLDELEFGAAAELQNSQTLVVSLNNIKAGNQDAQLNGRMWMEFDQHQRPFMFLRASFADVVGASTARYLPVKIMPQKVQDWLVQGIKQAHVPAGDLQFHGRLEDLRKLARTQAGEFFVDFRVEQAELSFAPGWLNASDGNGHILFHNVGVSFDLDQVSYEKVDQATATGRIDNFAQALLELDIKARASVTDAVRIWVESPVGLDFRNPMANLHDLDGMVSTQVKLRLPLSARSSEPQQITVLVDFDAASARSRNWGLELSQINGRLEVSDNQIRANRIQAMFFGDPVGIDIESSGTAGTTLASIDGVIESGNLLHRLPEEFRRYLEGKSGWRLELAFPNKAVTDDQPFLSINAASDLSQTSIRLPQPLGKSAGDLRRLAVDLQFFPQRIDFEIDMESDLLGRGRLVSTAEQDFKLESLDLAFARELHSDRQPGLNLYGVVTETSIDEWIGSIGDSVGASPGILNSIDLEIDRVDAYNRSFDQVKLEVLRSDLRFSGLVEAEQFRGSFEVPLRLSTRAPVVVDLEYLRLEKVEQEAEYSGLRPSSLVDFRINSETLVYDGMLFNDLVIEGRPISNNLYLDKFNLRRDSVMVTSTAKWEYDETSDKHLSTLSTRIKGPQVGEAMAGIGFGDSMDGGEIDFSGDFSWPAPLLAFRLDNFKGDAKMKIEDGVLNNVEPGSGRFVGLLSLSALPRRLSLDFSDLLIEGMQFDSITGTYSVRKGELFTKTTRMDGTAAKIKIKGKTGLLRRDYDQIISVTPKIRQTLPLIGAVSAGSTVGWGLLLLQNLFKKAIDDAVEIEYKVSGSWDDPKIELIKAVDENQKELPQFDK